MTEITLVDLTLVAELSLVDVGSGFAAVADAASKLAVLIVLGVVLMFFRPSSSIIFFF